MQTYRDEDADLELIRARRVAVMGYGAQGRAHALNLRDSGVRVTVGLREGSPSREACEREGLAVATPAEAAAACDLVMMLVPDEVQPGLYRDALEDAMPEGAALLFAHGYNIHYGTLAPRADLDVLMVAPLGIGDMVRSAYEAGQGVPARPWPLAAA